MRNCSDSGFALVPALFLVVVLSALAVVAVRIGNGQQHTVIMGLQQARALAAARTRAEQLRSRIVQNPGQMMENLAAGWRDREANLAVQLSVPAPAANPSVAIVLASGQRVRHVRFGEGVVTRIDGSGPEAMVSIFFDAAQERTFRADLLGDKVELL